MRHRRTRSTPTLLGVVAVLALVAGSGGAVAEVDEPPPPPRVLVYGGTESYRHSSVDVGAAVLAQLAAETGAFTVELREDPAAISAANLARFDLVLWNSPSGVSFDGVGAQPAQGCAADEADGYACTAAPFSPQQRDEFVAWSECGGGSVGIHMALDAWHDWDAWDELTSWVQLDDVAPGEAELFVESSDPVAAPFGAEGSSFRLTEEYSTTLPGDGPQDAPQYEQLLGIGAFTDPAIEAAQGALFPDRGPVAWTSSFRGKNRVFMTSLGHSDATWDLPAYREHLLAGIAGVAEVRPDPACVGAIGGGPVEPPPAGLPPVQGVVVSPPLAQQDDAVPGFLPQELTLPRGSSLTYVSADLPTDGAHVLVSRERGLFKSGGVSTGRSEVVGVAALPPGTYPYVCQIHPAMTGTLTIS